MVTVGALGAKFSSKRELERFLRVDCGAYLPDSKCLTIYHYRDLLSGKKKVRTCSGGGGPLL